MKLWAIAIFAGLGTSPFALDAKSDCFKALNQAKQVGLPISPADLHSPPSSQCALHIEKLINDADKALRKFRTPLGVLVDIDLKNIERKKKGMKVLPYPKATDAQESERAEGVLAVIQELGATTGPRMTPKISVLALPHQSTVKQLVKVELEEVKRLAKAGDQKGVVMGLKLTRRLIELARGNATVIEVLSQQATEQQYYAALEKLARDYPFSAKFLNHELLAPIQRPSIAQILREEFLWSLAYMDSAIHPKQSKKPLTVGNWKLLGDAESLKVITALVNSWTFAYKELKGCKTGQELQKRYNAIAPSLPVQKSKGREDSVFGPTWAENARALDNAEFRRRQTIKALRIG